jgi:hypothetical protein
MCVYNKFYHGFISLQKNYYYIVHCSLSIPKEFVSIAQHPMMYLFVPQFLFSIIKNAVIAGNFVISKDLAALSIICVEAY